MSGIREDTGEGCNSLSFSVSGGGRVGQLMRVEAGVYAHRDSGGGVGGVYVVVPRVVYVVGGARMAGGQMIGAGRCLVVTLCRRLQEVRMITAWPGGIRWYGMVRCYVTGGGVRYYVPVRMVRVVRDEVLPVKVEARVVGCRRDGWEGLLVEFPGITHSYLERIGRGGGV